MMNMDNPLIPYGKHTITDSDIEAVIDVLKNENLTQGNKHQLFESKLAQYFNSDYVLSTNSATSALHLACLALGLSKNDYCWTSPISFVASANCALYCGAKIDFIDINPETGLMCMDTLEEKLISASLRNCLPKVVIPVHLGGTSCDMHRLRHLADYYGFYIIEDASHAIGGSYKESTVGSCKYSDLAVFSFHPVKIITCGEGGCVSTNSYHWAKQIHALRSHGIYKDTSDHITPSQNLWYYEQQSLGFNYRLTDIQAALGISQLLRLPSIIAERTKIHNHYSLNICHPKVTLLTIPDDVLSSFHLTIIRLEDCTPAYHSMVFSKLRNSGIGVQLHYLPIHLQPYYRQLGFSDGLFPNAERYATSAMSIPIYPGLTQKDIQYVISTLHSILD